jgi:hypothetical protein
MAAVNTALKQSGFAVFVAQPSRLVSGPGVTVNSGNLVLMQSNSQYAGQANDTDTILTLGGASIQADSSLGYPYLPLPNPSIPPPPVAAAPGGAVPPAGTGTSGVVPPAPQVAGAPPAQVAPVLAAQNSSLPGGLKPAWVVLALLGAALLAAGLRRLPDEVLATRGAACTLGGP